LSVEKQEEMNYWDSLALEAAREKVIIRTEKWRKAARNWLAHYAEKKARDLVISTIVNYVKLDCGAQVLDVGCGPGKWVKLFVERGYFTTGVDSSPWMIRLAKHNLQKNHGRSAKFYVMNVAKLDLPSDLYDLVSCVTVLQHIFDDEDWRSAVREIVRVTKPLGHMLIFEAAPSSVLKMQTHHQRLRTMKEYVREFEKADARLIHWRATDLSFPLTYMGLRKFAASFEDKVYYFSDKEHALVPPSALSLLSRFASMLAEPIDYKLGMTPLSFLSVGKILLFRRIHA